MTPRNSWHARPHKAITIPPRPSDLTPRASAYALRGLACYSIQEYDKAIADFGEVIRLDPKNASAYKSGGPSGSRQYDKAIADYTRPSYRSRYVDAYGSGVTCCERRAMGFGEVIRLDPRRIATRSGAIDIAEYAIADLAHPIDPGTSMPTALCWKKEYDRAMADYGEVIRLDPKNASAYNARGAIWHIKRSTQGHRRL